VEKVIGYLADSVVIGAEITALVFIIILIRWMIAEALK